MSELSAVFSNNEWKIIPYCVYHDVTVNAVVDRDGRLSICDEDQKDKTKTLFYINGETINYPVLTKTMRMSEFIRLSRERGVVYIDYVKTCQDTHSRYKISDLDLIKEEIIYKRAKNNQYLGDKYCFLLEKNLIVESDNDQIVISKSMAEEIFNHRLKKILKALFDASGVDTFNEIIDILQDYQKTPNNLN